MSGTLGAGQVWDRRTEAVGSMEERFSGLCLFPLLLLRVCVQLAGENSVAASDSVWLLQTYPARRPRFVLARYLSCCQNKFALQFNDTRSDIMSSFSKIKNKHIPLYLVRLCEERKDAKKRKISATSLRRSEIKRGGEHQRRKKHKQTARGEIS